MLAKLGTGTASGTILTFISWYALSDVMGDGPYPDSNHEAGDGLESATLFLYGAAIGCSLGFPLGVTAVDSHDSAPKTFLFSGAAFLGGLSLAAAGAKLESDTLAASGIISSFAGPPVVSIIVSEKSRKSPQDHRVSFVLAPIPNGGLFLVSKLGF